MALLLLFARVMASAWSYLSCTERDNGEVDRENTDSGAVMLPEAQSCAHLQTADCMGVQSKCCVSWFRAGGGRGWLSQRRNYLTQSIKKQISPLFRSYWKKQNKSDLSEQSPTFSGYLAVEVTKSNVFHQRKFSLFHFVAPDMLSLCCLSVLPNYLHYSHFHKNRHYKQQIIHRLSLQWFSTDLQVGI